MPEKERPREEENPQERKKDEVRIKVTVHGKSAGTIVLKRGARLNDLLEELKKRGYKIGQYMVVLNGREIKIDPYSGIPAENPLLDSVSTLQLLKKILGGSSR